MQQSMDGAATGAASLADFYKLSNSLRNLDDGGVYINIGSSVVLPETFLKALTLANNLGDGIKNYQTANIDHLSEYRPLMNVVKRSTGTFATGYELIGMIELLVPLLARLLVETVTSDLG